MDRKIFMQERITPALFKIIILFGIIGIFIPNSLFAQRTQVDQGPQTTFLKGKELWRNNKYAAAQQQFNEYLETGDSELRKAEALFYKARCAMELYQKQTQHLFKKYVREYPELGKKDLAYFNIGKYHFREKRLEEAREWLTKLEASHLETSNKNEYHFMLGYAFYKAEEYEKAKLHLKAIMNQPNNYYGMGNYYYGYISYLQGDYGTAIKRFKNIEDHEKFGRVVPVYITQFHLLSGHYDSTISYGEKVILKKKVGKKDEIRSYIGQAYFYKKDFQNVIRYLEPLRKESFKLNKEQKYQLALSYFKTNQKDKALPLFESIEIKEDSLGQNVAYHLGDIYTKKGEKEKARNLFQFASNLSYDQKIKKQSAFNYAQLSYDLGYQKTAIDKLKEFIDNYPESELANKAQKLLGDILLTTTNYQQALALIEDIEQPTDQMLEAYQKIAYQRGLELFQDNRYKKSREIFIKALENPLNERFKALSYFWLGESYFNLESYEKAAREYQNFLYQDEAEQTPYFAVAYYNLGYSYFKMEEYSKARGYFDKYISLDQTTQSSDRYSDGLARLGDCYFGLNNYEKAIDYYNKVIEQNNQSVPYALYQKGIIQGLQNKPDQKIETLKKLSQDYGKSPYVDDALFEIGNEYFLQGQYQMAINHFRYLIQDYPNSSYYRAAMLKMGLVKYNQKKDEQAIRQFQEIVREYPYSREAKEAINQLKTIYIDKGQADSLFAFLKTVKNADLTASFQDSATYNAAFSHIKNNDCDKAIDALNDYLKEFSKGYFSVNANYYLALCLENRNQEEQAIPHYKTVVKRGPNQFLEPSIESLASIYFKKDNCSEAIKYYRQLEDIADKKRNRLTAFEGQMHCNFILGNYDECIAKANEILQTAFSSQEQKTKAQYYIAKSYYQQNQLERALPLLSQVYQSNTGEMGAEAKYLEASIYFQQEQYKKAQNTIYELKNNFSNYNYWVAKGFVLLGDVFVKLGNDFQAKHTLRSVIENYEGDSLTKIARKKLDNILEREKNADTQQQNMEPDTINQLQND